LGILDPDDGTISWLQQDIAIAVNDNLDYDNCGNITDPQAPYLFLRYGGSARRVYILSEEGGEMFFAALGASSSGRLCL